MNKKYILKMLGAAILSIGIGQKIISKENLPLIKNKDEMEELVEAEKYLVKAQYNFKKGKKPNKEMTKAKSLVLEVVKNSKGKTKTQAAIIIKKLNEIEEVIEV